MCKYYEHNSNLYKNKSYKSLHKFTKLWEILNNIPNYWIKLVQVKLFTFLKTKAIISIQNTNKLFRLFVFHAMPEQLALCYGNLSANLLRIPIPGKFHPTDSSYHADKSGQLPKTEPLRLRCSSLQRLWHWQLVTGGLSENGYCALQKSLNTEYQEIIGAS